MRFTFPPAVSEPLKGSPSHQPHGINSHYSSGKPQSSAYASSPSFHQASSPLGPGTATPDSYSLSPLRPPSVLPPQPPAPPQQQDPSGAFLSRTALGLTADKREEVTAGLSAPPNRDLAELPGGQDGALGTMSQSELEKQRQVRSLLGSGCVHSGLGQNGENCRGIDGHSMCGLFCWFWSCRHSGL